MDRTVPCAESSAARRSIAWTENPQSPQQVPFNNSTFRLRHPTVATMMRAPFDEDINLGQVPERSNGHAWKACVHESVPRVRIPPCPPLMNKELTDKLRTWRDENPPHPQVRAERSETGEANPSLSAIDDQKVHRQTSDMEGKAPSDLSPWRRIPAEPTPKIDALLHR